MQAITTATPLQTLRQQLDQCRAAGKRAVFPEELKRQAVSLSQEYSSGAIINALVHHGENVRPNIKHIL